MKKEKIAKIALYLGALSISIGLGIMFAEHPSAESAPTIVAEEPVVEEKVEETTEEASIATPVRKVQKNTIKNVPQSTPVPTPTATPVPTVEPEKEIKISLEIGKKNISKISGETIKVDDFQPKVVYEGKNITSTCNITIDTTKVGIETGKYDVILNASCEGDKTAKRYAIVNIYKPAPTETPKAESKQDTTSAKAAIETPVITDKNGNETRETKVAQELTKVTIYFNDGSVKTFVKTEVENIYAYQIERKMVEAEIPSNYKLDGNTLTINGNTFVAE